VKKVQTPSLGYRPAGFRPVWIIPFRAVYGSSQPRLCLWHSAEPRRVGSFSWRASRAWTAMRS